MRWSTWQAGWGGGVRHCEERQHGRRGLYCETQGLHADTSGNYGQEVWVFDAKEQVFGYL